MQLSKKLVIVFLILAGIGFLDATFLTVKHYTGGPIPCSLFNGCETVTNSPYSQIGPIPLALLGALYYTSLLVLSIIYLDIRREKLMRIAGHLTWVGLMTSIALVYLQVFVIHALCLYCMASAVISTTLFILGQIILRKTKPLPPMIITA